MNDAYSVFLSSILRTSHHNQPLKRHAKVTGRKTLDISPKIYSLSHPLFFTHISLKYTPEFYMHFKKRLLNGEPLEFYM